MKMQYLPLLAAAAVVAPLLLGAQGARPRGKDGQRTISLSPASPGSFAETFTLVYSNPRGLNDVVGIRLLANDRIEGQKACYIYYVLESGKFLLVHDSGEGSDPLESDRPVRNAHCTVYPDFHATQTTTTLKLQIRVALNPDRRTPTNLYTYVEKSVGESQFEWQGVWAVPKPLPPPSTTE